MDPDSGGLRLCESETLVKNLFFQMICNYRYVGTKLCKLLTRQSSKEVDTSSLFLSLKVNGVLPVFFLLTSVVEPTFLPEPVKMHRLRAVSINLIFVNNYFFN